MPSSLAPFESGSTLKLMLKFRVSLALPRSYLKKTTPPAPTDSSPGKSRSVTNHRPSRVIANGRYRLVFDGICNA